MKTGEIQVTIDSNISEYCDLDLPLFLLLNFGYSHQFEVFSEVS